MFVSDHLCCALFSVLTWEWRLWRRARGHTHTDPSPPLSAAHPPLTPTLRLRPRVVGIIAQAVSEHLNPLLYLSLLSDYSFQLALPLLST